MSFELREVNSDGRFDDIVPLQWVSYKTPHNGFFILFCPTRVQWHHADPTSRWIEVVDTDTGKAIAAAQWNVQKSDPFIKPTPPMTAYWWPEGEGRQFADMALGQWLGPRAERMRKPHLLLNQCFVHPDYQRRGAGSVLTRWGIEKVDEMGLEAFLESTDDGMLLYAKHGFAVINEFNLNPVVSDPSNEWKRLQEEILPMHRYFMWRPVGSKYHEGKTVIPWEMKV